MTKPELESMVNEIRYDLARRDWGKARIVLSYLGSLDEKDQRRLLFELSLGDVEFVLPLLAFLVENHPELCAAQPLIREMLLSRALDYPDLLLEFLRDEACENRTLYVEIIGEIRLEKAVPILIEMLMTSMDTQLIKSIMQALGLIGLSEATSALADFLYVSNRDLVVCAVRAMGMMGSPSAMHRLSERMGTDNELDLLILEIFSEVQDNISLKKLSETLGSHHAHMRNYARTLLVRIGPKSVPFLLENLHGEDADLQINSLNVLGEIGDASAFTPIRKLLHGEPKNANVRFAAYEALSLLPMQQGAYVLAGGLADPVEHVRIAAARAIDRNYGEILSAGMKNMVRFRDEDAERIVKTIIHAQADSIFLDLAGDTIFQEMALVILSQAHEDVSRHYAHLMTTRGFSEFAGKIRPEEVRLVKKPRACAVDDSRMILSIYKNTLHELGVEPVLFEFPASALEWLEKEKPDIVFTDLNMPEITGIELTRNIRRMYSANELPIVMVTTQSDIQDHEAAREAGINRILFKPFDVAALKSALSEFVKG
jgi:CheY-like chemotaxis protein